MSVFALLEKLASPLEKEVNLVLNSKQEADTLTNRLKKIQVGLEDAERKGAMDTSVRDWLKELEDVACEMVDVLDEWEVMNLQVRLDGYEGQLSTDPWEKVYSLVLSLCLCFKHVVDRREITKKMKSLSGKIDSILEAKGRYNFVPIGSNHSHEFGQSESTSGVTVPKVYGRDSDLKELVEKLVPSKEEDSGTHIISIVGIGGVGKTTLAQSAYNHPAVKGYFGMDTAWVSVPNPFDSLTVARRILEAFGEASAHIQTLETLVTYIKKIVEKKKFLLVLDNVWTVDRFKWESLKGIRHGASGSRILVTTRNELDARMMDTTQWQRLSPLLDEDCAAILNAMALDGKTEEECKGLIKIGPEIANKCHGLPLAARIVGSMLAVKRTEEEWRYVLENPLWDHEDGGGDLYRILKLSYADLSPLLKRCFLSCTIFPIGSVIYVDELIRIWMANGYLNSEGAVDEVKSKGLAYFQNLEMRSFFRRVDVDQNDKSVIAFKVHDVMHEFSIYLSDGERNFIMGRSSENGKNSTFPRRMPWSSLERVRMFCAEYVSPEELPLGQLESVRVLRINKCNLQELPHKVGKLIHLRYLNLSYNPIKELPDTVSGLYNLQTLAIEYCQRLCKLPKHMGKLTKLRHFLNSGTESLEQYPQEVGELTGLWTLSEFRAKDKSELGILSNLNQLRGSLRIFLPRLNSSSTVDTLEEVGRSNLKNKIHLRILELFFQEEEQNDGVVDDALEPPPNLECLIMHCGSSNWMSHWIDMTSSLDNLRRVEFDGDGKCCDVAPFGKLPILEELVISNCGFERLSVDFLGVEGMFEEVKGDPNAKSLSPSKEVEVGWFSKLKKLCFVNCRHWCEWEDIGEKAQYYSVPMNMKMNMMMPHLQELIIHSCSNLMALPVNVLRHVGSLQCLTIDQCWNLEKRYVKKEGGSDWEKISHIPEVRCCSTRESLRVSFITYTAALRWVINADRSK